VRDKGSFTADRHSVEAMRGVVGSVQSSFPDLQLGLTGLPVLENDEMVASQNDSNFASWLALAGVALLYLLVYRGWRYPPMAAPAPPACAFYAAMLADLKAVAELGWIAGSGVLLCALSCLIVMPPLLTLLDKRFRTKT